MSFSIFWGVLIASGAFVGAHPLSAATIRDPDSPQVITAEHAVLGDRDRIRLVPWNDPDVDDPEPLYVALLDGQPVAFARATDGCFDGKSSVVMVACNAPERDAIRGAEDQARDLWTASMPPVTTVPAAPSMIAGWGLPADLWFPGRTQVVVIHPDRPAPSLPPVPVPPAGLMLLSAIAGVVGLHRAGFPRGGRK